MEKIASLHELRETIVRLEYQKTMDGRELKEHFRLVAEHLKPAHVIRATFNELISTADLKEKLLSSIIGIASGLITKRMIVGKSQNIIRNIFASLVQKGVTSFLALKSEYIISRGLRIANLLIKKAKTRQ